ncbi:MAG: zinc ABC transporter substrate-binding protein [Sorangiineae bacterium]|nr:zinc ABC transporter substrate-binding protein [Polyangiaceae bacterium]MEB2322142.1 zinc ABC transporter substrate-binding protein [Sorangiineae bacterium]
MRTGALGAVVLLMAVLGVVACRRATPAERPLVAVSVLPQAWFVERLAGDAVEIETLLPPGASPHTYEPRFEQAAALSRAAVYVEVGHPSFLIEQTWLPRFRADNPKMLVVDSSAGAERRPGDAHVWLAPSVAREMAKNVAAALIERMPERRAELERRRAALLETIDEVDREVRRTLADVKGRRFYVFHPAWGYFAAEYGLEQVSIEQEGHEPDVRAVEEVVRRARADHARAIFTQPQSSREAAELVAKEIGAELVELDPLARDWAKNLRSVASALEKALR